MVSNTITALNPLQGLSEAKDKRNSKGENAGPSVASGSGFPVPFALFIGPQRAGTSWVDKYLRARGDICLPHSVKEIYFFDRYYNKGPNFYRSHFSIKPDHRIASEITTKSFADPLSPKRIFQYFGKNVSLICPLREPVRRSFSLYLHYRQYGMVKGDLREAVRQRPDIIETSRYAEHLERWFDVFGQDQISICFQEELEKDQDEYGRKICNALNIPFNMPSKFNLGRQNYATRAPSYHLAKYGLMGAEWLRERNLYSVVNMAKNLGLKKLFFGSEKVENGRATMTDQDADLLNNALQGEKEKLQDILGRDIPLWK